MAAGIGHARRVAAAKRSVIRLMDGRLAKRVLYAQVSRQYRQDVRSVRERASVSRRVIWAHTRRRSWPDWLREQAQEGDAAALQALRTRRSVSVVLGAAWIRGESRSLPLRMPGRVAQVTSTGTVWREVAGAQLREDEHRIYLQDAFDDGP